MKRQFYLSLLFLYGVVTQEIGSLNENNIRRSSFDLHIRKKRIIDNSQNPTIVQSIREVPYIVSIHQNENFICGGSILSPYFILTAVTCIGDPQEYHILSGSSKKTLGIRHDIRRKIPYAPTNTTSEEKNLLLLIIYPPIDLINSPNRAIELHSGAISLKSLLGCRTYGTLSGWGCIQRTPYSSFSQNLRSIKVPIIDFRRCQSIYSFLDLNTGKNFCTCDPKKRKLSCAGDNGGPFVVDGKLLGVLSWNSRNLAQVEPDIFVKLSHPTYVQWIMSNLRYSPQTCLDSKKLTRKLKKNPKK